MTVLVYISQFEGLGNKDSDFDVYVISRDAKCNTIEMAKINNSCCDIEFWALDDLERIVDNFNALDRTQIKLLKRIQESVSIRKELDLSSFMNNICKLELNNIIYKYFKRLVNAEYDDALKMYKNGEIISCLSCCQRAVTNLIAAINAKNGHANLNLKWTNKIFIDNKGYDEDLYNDYLNSYIYVDINRENIKSVSENMLDFISDYRNFSMF